LAGDAMCYFCNNLETIQHLFFDCVLSKFLWRVIQVTFGLTKSRNIKHVHGGWVQNMNEKNKRLLFVRVGTMFWSIWLNQNDIIFNKKTNLILFVSYVQGNLLDKNMGIISKGGCTGDPPNCMPVNGDTDNEFFCQTWMVV
jgi:hypothetical protein